MGGGWITTTGETGTVRIAKQNDEWLVEKPSTDGAVKCVFHGEFELPADDTAQTLEIQVEKFMQATGQGPDYLFAAPIGGETDRKETRSEETTDETIATEVDSQWETRTLSELSGDGEFVTVEAVVDDILAINKDESNAPDVIGVLRQKDGSFERMFVVNDGVDHPYLKEDRAFVFQNVKDHYYERGDKIQVMITRHTQFKQGETVETPSEPSSQSSPTSSTARPSSQTSSSNESLDKIAESMVGDEEFTETQTKESAISKAKQKARRQQRDPAIDPKLNED